MANRLVTAIIEKGSDNGYSIYLPDVLGVYGNGLTEEEAKEALKEAIESIKSYAEESNNWEEYEVLKENYAIDFKYDLSGFFLSHDYFDVTSLAKRIGINASLLRSYKAGVRTASKETKKRIEDGIHSIANELCAIEFLNPQSLFISYKHNFQTVPAWNVESALIILALLSIIICTIKCLLKPRFC